MRPDPHPPQTPEASSRIIYIGDVRRRRNRKRSPDTQYLAALALIALAGWVAWAAVLFTLSPARLLTYLAFLAPLSVALASTGALISYAVEWRRGEIPSLVQSVRRGGIAAAGVVLNLVLLASHHWTVVALGVIVLAAVGAEAALSQRQP